MDVNLTRALGAVRMAVGDVAQKAANRRLTVLQDRAPCKIGCNGCCSRLLDISLAEASLMVEHLRRTGEWESARIVAQGQFRAAQETPPLTWFKMNRKCPALDPRDGSCRVYEVRPALCSTHFVTSDPAGCDPWSVKASAYEPHNMDDLYMEFQKRLSESVDSYGVMQMVMPIPVALLVADRIQIKTSLSVSELVSLLFNEFA